MAIETTIKHNGAQSTSTLSGDIRLEEDRGRLVVYDRVTRQELNVLDSEGLKTYDQANSKEIVRTGRLPDGQYGNVTAKPGKGMDDIYG